MSVCKLSSKNVIPVEYSNHETGCDYFDSKINKAIAGFVTVSEVAKALGISERQIQHLKKKVKEEGAAALIHKNSQKSSLHAILHDTVKRIFSHL